MLVEGADRYAPDRALLEVRGQVDVQVEFFIFNNYFFENTC